MHSGTFHNCSFMLWISGLNPCKPGTNGVPSWASHLFHCLSCMHTYIKSHYASWEMASNACLCASTAHFLNLSNGPSMHHLRVNLILLNTHLWVQAVTNACMATKQKQTPSYPLLYINHLRFSHVDKHETVLSDECKFCIVSYPGFVHVWPY